jgi:hypothetical protein
MEWGQLLFSQPPGPSLLSIFGQLDPIGGEAQPSFLVELAG